MTDRVIIDVVEGVANVRMNRPEKMNALDAEIFDGILAAAQQLRDDRSVRVAVLSGEGDAFSAGLDVSSLGEMATGALNPEALVPSTSTPEAAKIARAAARRLARPARRTSFRA